MRVTVAKNGIASDTRGSNYVEYMILVGVIALLAIPAFTAFGGRASATIRDEGTLVDKALPKMGF